MRNFGSVCGTDATVERCPTPFERVRAKWEREAGLLNDSSWTIAGSTEHLYGVEYGAGGGLILSSRMVSSGTNAREQAMIGKNKPAT